MRRLVIIALLFGCSQTGLNVGDGATVPADMPDAGTTVADAGPVVDVPPIPDWTRPDGVKPSVWPEAGVCPEHDGWTFINHLVTFCGSLPDGCLYVCGTRDGCIAGTYRSGIQIAYCPQDKQ